MPRRQSKYLIAAIYLVLCTGTLPLFQVRIPGPGGATSSGGSTPTLSYTGGSGVCNSSGGGGASSLVLPSSGTVNISSANLVYVYLVAGNNPSLITVSDGVNTWTPMSANVGGYTVNGYYAQNATGSSTYSLTITYNTTTNGFAACMIAFSGALTTGALYSQGTVTYSSGTTSFSSASLTPPRGRWEVLAAGWGGDA